MHSKNYIGVTGYTNKEEIIKTISSLFDSKLDFHSKFLMVGVLVSEKTYNGGTNKYPNRYPAIDTIDNIFINNPYTLNLIHLHAAEDNLLEIMKFLALKVNYLDGFQLNITWPDPNILYKYKEFCYKNDINAKRIVLQIGKQALAQTDNPERLLIKLRDYKLNRSITDILLDASGGIGIPLDKKLAEIYLSALSYVNDQTDLGKINLGIAGGLGSDTLDLLGDLPEKFNISIDAESQLRDENDILKLDRVISYVTKAYELML